jgi:endoglycosylceramidase
VTRHVTVAVAVVLATAAALPAAAHAKLPRLHATRGADPAILTSDGRQVLLRGVNVNQLGDYYRQVPSLPSTFPLHSSDFTAIRGLGMNTVRLIVHWSALEPTRGAFNTKYVARIRKAVRWAAKRGIYVVLDMHQDAWGKYIASPKSEICAPGGEHQHGWDGAPKWATITNGTPTCFFSIRELAPAVGAAFQNFWDDTDGIQGELVTTWARLARAFAAEPAVAGYDLMNEPNPGYSVGLSDTGPIAQFYARTIAAIRQAERGPRKGFSHIAFFEPGAIWSAAGTDAPPAPALITDANVVFAPHLYGGSLAAVSVDDGYRNAETAAAQYGTTVWSGEWGWFGDPKADEANIREYAVQEDAHRWGGAWWDWKQACGDPHMFSNGDDTTPEPVSVSLNRFACPSRRALGMPPTTRRLLTRPYVRFAPGRITSLQSDPDRATAHVGGSDPDTRHGSCRLELWVPGKAKPRATGTKVRQVRARRVRGGWTVTACARGAYTLKVARRPVSRS